MGYPLAVLPGLLAVCRLPADDLAYLGVGQWARPGPLLSVTRTAKEISVVCAENCMPADVTCERGWRAIQVQGPLKFSLVGVLASLLQPLAQARVSVFVVSTYDTDVILVKEDVLGRAIQALGQAGHTIDWQAG